MSLYSLFETNENLEQDGIWIEYGPASNGKPIRIKIARSGGSNKEFNKRLEKATKPYRKIINSLNNEKAEEIYLQVFAETVVLAWENVENRSGSEMEFNIGNVLKLFNELPELYRDLRDQSNNIALFRTELLEADLGNSGTSLSMVLNKDRLKAK